jgi:hypothetical protein
MGRILFSGGPHMHRGSLAFLMTVGVGALAVAIYVALLWLR